jgi:hypothetical protein
MRAFESVGPAALRTALIGRACELYRSCATQAGNEDLELAVVLEDDSESGHQTGRSRVSSATEEIFDHRFALVQRSVGHSPFPADKSGWSGRMLPIESMMHLRSAGVARLEGSPVS